MHVVMGLWRWQKVISKAHSPRGVEGLGGCGRDKTLKNFEGSHRPTTWVVKRRHCWVLKCPACSQMFCNKVSLYKLKITQADSNCCRKINWHAVERNPQAWSFKAKQKFAKPTGNYFEATQALKTYPSKSWNPNAHGCRDTAVPGSAGCERVGKRTAARKVFGVQANFS